MLLVLDDSSRTTLLLLQVPTKTFSISQDVPFDFIDNGEIKISETDPLIKTYTCLRFNGQYYSFKIHSRLHGESADQPKKEDSGW